MKIEVSEAIERPVADVFRWYAHDHVRNHPRWDPEMELEQISDGPIGVGTIIRRRNTHFDEPVEGTMEVVEFEPDSAFAVVIHDGPVETHGRVTFKAEIPHQTIITITAHFPGMEDSNAEGVISSAMQRSARNIKRLVESEV